MLVKDGIAYLQAGGGIVFDSDPFDEWEETMNKLRANMMGIKTAEEKLRAEEDDVALGAGVEEVKERRRERGEELVKELIVGDDTDGGGRPVGGGGKADGRPKGRRILI